MTFSVFNHACNFIKSCEVYYSLHHEQLLHNVSDLSDLKEIKIQSDNSGTKQGVCYTS